MFKHRFSIPVHGQDSVNLLKLMDEVASITGINPPYYRYPPFMGLCKPFSGSDENTLINAVGKAVTQMKRSRITFHGLSHFGKQFIILPAQATLGAAVVIVELNKMLSHLPEGARGSCNGDNVLHIPITEKITREFDRFWPEIQKVRVDLMTFPLVTIDLCRKPVEGGRWEVVERFHIPA